MRFVGGITSFIIVLIDSIDLFASEQMSSLIHTPPQSPFQSTGNYHLSKRTEITPSSTGSFYPQRNSDSPPPPSSSPLKKSKVRRPMEFYEDICCQPFSSCPTQLLWTSDSRSPGITWHLDYHWNRFTGLPTVVADQSISQAHNIRLAFIRYAMIINCTCMLMNSDNNKTCIYLYVDVVVPRQRQIQEGRVGVEGRL